MRKVLVLAAVAVAAVAVAGIAIAGKPGTNDTKFDYAIGLWGDLPYSAVQANRGVPNLIADMNRQELEFTVHDGDLKAGNGPPAPTRRATCSDALYTRPSAGSTRSNGRRCSRRATTTGRTATGRRTAASSRSSDSTRTKRLLQHAVLARPASDAAGGPDDAALPRRERRRRRACENRRWTVKRGDLRDGEHPGVVQQPLRHRARPCRVRGAERGGHRLAAADLRQGDGRRLGRGDDHHAGRSWLRPDPTDAGADPRSEDARRDRRASRRLPRLPHRAS